MCDIFNSCQTLDRRTSFYWCIDNGVYYVRKDVDRPSIYSFSSENYAACHELILSQPNGSPLGASGTGVVPPDSLGALLESNDKQRPLATYLAAIAVAEGMFQFENLGRGPGRGIRLYPVLDEAVHPVVYKNNGVDENIENQQPYIDSSSAAKTTADNLRDLADRVESTKLLDRMECELEFTDLNSDELPRVITVIQEWENAATDSRFIYKFTVDNDKIATQLHEGLCSAKSAAGNSRKYSRVNLPKASSRCLYVGSSRSVTQRMKQHLGYSHPAVYSLHMKHWPMLPSSTVKIEIQKYAGDVGQDVLQAIEDGIWHSSRPLFGKQGAR